MLICQLGRLVIFRMALILFQHYYFFPASRTIWKKKKKKLQQKVLLKWPLNVLMEVGPILQQLPSTLQQSWNQKKTVQSFSLFFFCFSFNFDRYSCDGCHLKQVFQKSNCTLFNCLCIRSAS